MKNLKTLISLLLALAMSLFLLVGCKTATNESPESPVLNDTALSPESPEQTGTSDDGEIPYSAGIDENGFWTDVKARDYIEMFEYRGKTIPNEIHNISDDALQVEIDGILANYASTTPVTDRAVVDGDTVNIDYVGSIDGVEFDGGSTDGMGTDVIIGETEYIDDFLAQLIGHMPGDTVNVEVTFPDDYMEATLQGKDALFITTINHINGEPIGVELTDAFVAENLTASYGWTTVADMKDKMRSNMRKHSIEQYLMDYFTTEVVIKSVPDQLIKYQQNVMLYYYQDYADYYGMTINDLLANEGLESIDDLIEQYSEYNRQNAVYYLVLQAVAEDAGISVNISDLSDYFMDIYGTSDYSAQEVQFGLPYLMHSALCAKVNEYIIENAVLL